MWIDSYNVFLYHLISFILFQENEQKQLPHHQDFNQMFASSSFQIFPSFEKDKGFLNQFFTIVNYLLLSIQKIIIQRKMENSMRILKKNF